jgi:hypothetical protein
MPPYIDKLGPKALKKRKSWKNQIVLEEVVPPESEEEVGTRAAEMDIDEDGEGELADAK